MTRLFLLIAAILAGLAVPAIAQELLLDGDWDGGVRVAAGMELPLTLHLRGGLSTMDSPDQGAANVQLIVTREGDDIIVEVPSAKGVFTLRPAADGVSLAGSLAQHGAQLPAHFARRAAGAPVPVRDRPQMPKPPFPYGAKEVEFPSDAGVMLAGTLIRPAGAGLLPAVVLIAGSGPQNRDETVSGHKPFLIIADRLARAGIAVLRYDKRGVGGSSGDYRGATAADFVTDGRAALAWLRRQPGIDPNRIGLIGHSEGAEIAPEIAGGNPDIAFLVLLAPPGVRGDQVLLTQKRAIELASGMPADIVDRSIATQTEMIAAVMASSDAEAIRSKVSTLLMARGVPADRAAVIAADAASPAFRGLLDRDPIPALKMLDQPVLVIAGARDLQVLPDVNLPPIRAALAGNRDARIVLMPGLNHLLQPAATGTPQEYVSISTTIDPAVLDLIEHWVTAKAKR
jgi:pimeloyl-ACP methyl ester carboxylesterase